MDNLDLLFKYNTGQMSKIKIDNAYRAAVCHVGNAEGLWTGQQINYMISFVNGFLLKYKNVKIPVYFILDGETFIDKLTYVFFECICYYLIERGYPVQVFMNVKREIGIEGIESSPLLLLNNTKNISIKRYPEKFERDLYGNHFRRLIKAKAISTNIVGDVYTEIDSYLKPFDVSEEFRDKVAETIAELVGNATEHAIADCLIDIDVTTPYEKVGEPKLKQYYGVNIAVLNFSDKLLGDDLKFKIEDNASNYSNGRYSKVAEAYDYHKSHFNELYCEDDFFNIASFQHKISGRLDIPEGIGGTGLTHLIKSLQELSDAYRCYVISGSRCVNFSHNFLEYDCDGWIGFNEKNDFFKETPSLDIITDCLINMPGTAYNLNFVMKGE